MPDVSITLRDISVQFTIPEPHAALVTKEDLLEMACSALSVHHAGCGVQIIAGGKAQWSDMGPDYAKSDPLFARSFVDGPMDEEIEIDSCDDEFTALLDEDPDICG